MCSLEISGGFIKDGMYVTCSETEASEQVYYLHVLTSLRTCVKSQSKVDTFFLTFIGGRI